MHGTIIHKHTQITTKIHFSTLKNDKNQRVYDVRFIIESSSFASTTQL